MKLDGRVPRRAPALFLITSICLSSFGCATSVTQRDTPQNCVVLDSMVAHSGLEGHHVMSGKATVDANQYRLNGKIRIERMTARMIVVEFTSTMLFGTEREDFWFSMSGDTLRILDREHGNYFEGEEAASFLRDVLAMDFDIPPALYVAFGGAPACPEVDRLAMQLKRRGEAAFDGRIDGSPFQVVFGGRRLVSEIHWPVFGDEGFRDRLQIVYTWEEDRNSPPALRGMVLTLEDHEWRCKLSFSRY
jgi:hypothetical protein